MKKTGPISMWRQSKQIKVLVAVVFFLAMFTDNSAVTLIQSLAPALIKSMEYNLCNCTEVAEDRGYVNPTTGRQRGMNVTLASPKNKGFCRIGEEQDGRCHNDAYILKAIAAKVGALMSVGSVAELVANPLVGIICAKIGHRWPFLFGSIFQIIGNLLLMVATNEPVLFVGRVVQSVASTVVAISGLLMVSAVFTVARERSQVLAMSFASAWPLAGMINYPIGNGGYQLFGSYLPFGLVLALCIVDGALRLLVNTKVLDSNGEPYEDLEIAANDDKSTPAAKGKTKADLKVSSSESLLNQRKSEIPSYNSSHNGDISNGKVSNAFDTLENTESTSGTSGDGVCNSDQVEKDEATMTTEDQRQGSYLVLFSDSRFMVLALVSCILCFSITCVQATAPNWAINRLGAEQWQLGVVLGVTGTLQLIVNVCVGRFSKPADLWKMTFAGHWFLVTYLIVMPFCPTIWWMLLAQTLLLIPDSVCFCIIPDLFSYAVEGRGTALAAKAYSFYVASYTLAFALGPLTAGMLWQFVMSLRDIYLLFMAFTIISAVLSTYLKKLRV